MQNNPIIITISGDLGSGKSVLTERLVQHFKADRYSTGTAQRKLAEELGITTLQLNQRAETDSSIDDKIDAVFKSLANTTKNLIVDSRMAWHFLPQSFKVKLEVAPEIAAVRISKDNTRIGEGDTSADVILQSLLDRRASEKERFLSYYGADITKRENYNLAVNTYGADPDDIAKCVTDCIALWAENKTFHHYWIAPQILKIADKANEEECSISDGAQGDLPVIKQDGADYVVIAGASIVRAALADKLPLIAVKYV